LLRIYAGQYALTAQETSAMEEAIGRWRSLLDLMPLDDGAWENISRLYLFTGRKADALSAAGRAVMIRPGDYSHLVNLGLANELLGIKNDALSSYARALAIHPRLLYSPFWLELTQRDQVFAREVLSVSVQNEEDVYKKTGDVIESERLARLLMASGDRTRASQIVNAILSASPELEGAWELNAELTEDSNAATLHYRRASFLDPSDPLPHARLGDLEIASHDISAAATEWFTAWTLHKALRTPHSEIAKVRYRLPVCISNDAIPNNWIYYISPAFAFSSAFSTIAQAYETSGQIKEATMYRNLARVSRPQLKGAYDEER
jgi:tetratricopeptide (TPR) repeat protein